VARNQPVTPSPAEGVRVVIQAGGRGDRLRPLTDATPKALLEVEGTPMLERLIRQTVSCGFRKFTVLTGWLGEQIEEHISDMCGLPDDVHIDVRRESRPLGNIGALANLPESDETVLLTFGDLVTHIDFRMLLREYEATDAQVMLASHWERHQLRLGEIVADEQEVRDYLEKPEKHFLICSGIGLFAPAAIDVLRSLVPPVGLRDLVVASIAQELRVRHWLHRALWFDVNNIGDLGRAGEALRAAGPSG
jgi:NDP-sugar pyrophosphorylase family protein